MWFLCMAENPRQPVLSRIKVNIKMQADFIAIFVVKPLYINTESDLQKKNLHTDLLVDKKKL